MLPFFPLCFFFLCLPLLFFLPFLALSRLYALLPDALFFPKDLFLRTSNPPPPFCYHLRDVLSPIVSPSSLFTFFSLESILSPFPQLCWYAFQGCCLIARLIAPPLSNPYPDILPLPFASLCQFFKPLPSYPMRPGGICSASFVTPSRIFHKLPLFLLMGLGMPPKPDFSTFSYSFSIVNFFGPLDYL